MRARLSRTRAGAVGLCSGWLLVCLAHAAAQPSPSEKPVRSSTEPKTPAAADGSVPKLRLTRRSLDSLESQPKLAVEVNAGVISRATLRAELARGIGRFLRDVRTEPAFSHGHFVGWRVLELFPKRPEIRVQVLRPGDTVTRVNNQSVERPEDFKQVWDGLAKANELVLEIVRNGQASKLRYAIAD